MCWGKEYIYLKEKCIECGEIKEVKKRNNNSEPICRKCYRKRHQPKEKCIECGKIEIAIKRDESRNPICGKCYRKKYSRPKEKCIECGKIEIVIKRDENKNPICVKCYEKEYIPPKEKCIECGEIKEIGKRNNDNDPICVNCYRKKYLPKEKCIKCEEIKEVKKRDGNKNPICRRCYEKEKIKNNEKFKIIKRLRTLLRATFKKYSLCGKVKSSKKYGIDFSAIIKHLGPYPGDLKDYHIDHIFPLSAFNFDDPIHIKAAFAPENHQWLLAKENISKSNKYDKIEFNNYLEGFKK